MTIAASQRQIAPLCADLPPAAAVLAQIASRNPQLHQSSSINKAALDCIYLLIPRRSIKKSITPTRRQTDRTAPRSKSP